MKYINLSLNSIEMHDGVKAIVYPYNSITYLVNDNNIKFFSIEESIYEQPLFNAELPLLVIGIDGTEQTATKENVYDILKGLFDEDLTIQGQIDELKEDVIKHNVEADTKFEAINGDIQSLEAEIDDLKAVDSDQYSKIAVNQASIAELSVDFDELEEDFNIFKQKSAEEHALLSAATVENAKAIEEVATAFDDFKEVVEDEFDNVNDEIAALKAIDSSMSQQVLNNTNNIIAISAQTAVNAEKIKDNKELIDELFDSVDDVKEDVAENTSEIGKINTTLDTLLHSKGVQDVIDTFKDVEDFLSGITDSKTLTELIHNAIADSEAKTSSEIASVDSKLTDSINDLSDELKAEIEALNDDLEGLTSDVYTKAEVDAKDEAIKGLIDALEEDMDAMDADLSSQIDELSASTDNKLNTVKNNFKTDLEALSADVFTNIDEVDNRLDNKIDAIASDLEDMIEDVASNNMYEVVDSLDEVENPTEGMLAFCKSCSKPSGSGVDYVLKGEPTEMPSVPLTKLFNFEVSKVEVETNEYAAITFHAKSGADVLYDITKAKVCYMNFNGNRIQLEVGRTYTTTFEGVLYTSLYDGEKLTVSVDKPTVLYSANMVYYKDSYATDYAKFTVYTFKDGIMYQYDGERWNEFNSGSEGGSIDLSDYYTKEEVDRKIEEIVPTDLRNYYKKSETDALLNAKADKSALNDLSGKVATISADTKDAVSETELAQAIANQKFKTINGNTIVGEGNIVISEGGESYDDSELRGKINDLSGKVESISADTVTEQELAQAIANQQFKTINGESIKGSGNIVVTASTDLSNYYNKTEVDNKLSGKANTATTYTKTEVDNKIAEVNKVRYEYDASTNTLNIITE